MERVTSENEVQVKDEHIILPQKNPSQNVSINLNPHVILCIIC